jgi:hypothetical protein
MVFSLQDWKIETNGKNNGHQLKKEPSFPHFTPPLRWVDIDMVSNQNESATRLSQVADLRSAHMMEYGAYCAMI